MSRTCVSAVAICVLLAAPAAGQESALREGLDRMARDIAIMLNEEATRRDERLGVTFRPARTVHKGIAVYCGPLSFGLRNALHEGVEGQRDDMRMTSFDVTVADARAVSPPDVTMSWAWDGAESIEVAAHVLLAGERGRRFSDSLSGLGERERACLFTFRPGGGEVEAKGTGFLRRDPTFDSAGIVHRFGAGEKLQVVGELSSEGGSGAVWSVVPWKDPETGTWLDVFTADLAGGAEERKRDVAAFEAARRSDTVSAYDEYLGAWPSGVRVSEAQRLRAAAAERERQERDVAAFEAARRSDTVSAYDEYLGAWPSGAHVSEAQRLRAAAAEREHLPAVGDVFRDCPHCPEMVVVPSGSFTMGSPPSEEGRDDDEGPQRGVTIGSRFAVGVYEVTFAEWDACVSSGGCRGYRPDDEGWGRGQRPVMQVSWEDAQSYVSWLSRETGEAYRLLSESEWEYAARGGTQTRYWWGDSSSSQCRYANGADLSAKKHISDWTVADCDDGYYRTSPVGSFGSNSFGLHDVHGNVYEWVEDCWNESYVGAPRDGSAWERGECSRRVLRGGSWDFNPRFLRAANRSRYVSGDRDYDYGFRVARTFTS